MFNNNISKNKYRYHLKFKKIVKEKHWVAFLFAWLLFLKSAVVDVQLVVKT